MMKWWTSVHTQNNHSIGRNSSFLHVTCSIMSAWFSKLYICKFISYGHARAHYLYLYLHLSRSHNHAAPSSLVQQAQPELASQNTSQLLSEDFPVALKGLFFFNFISDMSPPCIHIPNALNMFWKERVKCIRSQRGWCFPPHCVSQVCWSLPGLPPNTPLCHQIIDSPSASLFPTFSSPSSFPFLSFFFLQVVIRS